MGLRTARWLVLCCAALAGGAAVAASSVFNAPAGGGQGVWQQSVGGRQWLLDQALKREPPDAAVVTQAYVDLGMAQRHAGDTDAAIASFESALAYPAGAMAEASYHAAHSQLLALYEGAARYDEALALIEQYQPPADGRTRLNTVSLTDRILWQRIEADRAQGVATPPDWLARRWAFLQKSAASGRARALGGADVGVHCILPMDRRVPRADNGGTAIVQLTLNPGLLEARPKIARSSGDAAIDRYAVALHDRIQCAPDQKRMQVQQPVRVEN
ncbi:hypothetical protein [Bordetella genomosp. 5]|uniref:Tetratricopeptide repeat protein n=1 Tax=Bordetella genomosp. 5 TaxID=1395608 RepID=A0A261TQL2_9BORD|nr:hypothetical protein [Bordetella genomosp. 5]OZI51909.1 hypothetical protein CAL25_10355 [Bordetella genomosp. 5]